MLFKDEVVSKGPGDTSAAASAASASAAALPRIMSPSIGIMLSLVLELVGLSAVPVPLYAKGATPALRVCKPLVGLACAFALSKFVGDSAGAAFVAGVAGGDDEPANHGELAQIPSIVGVKEEITFCPMALMACIENRPLLDS